MKKIFLAFAAVLCGAAVMAESIWDGDLASVSLQFGKKLQDVSVKTEDGALLISGTSEGNSVTYISAEIRVKPFVLGNRLITFEVCSDDAKTTDAFYVRLQNSKKQNIISFQSWGTLKSDWKKYHILPGSALPYMKWEPTEIKAPETDAIDRIHFYIGTRGNAKPMSVKIKNIAITDDNTPKVPVREGKKLAVTGSESIQRAVQNGDTVFVDTLVMTDAVTYTMATVPFTGSLEGKKLVFTGSTSTPAITGAFYVRGYNSKKQCILSYASWGNVLKAEPQTFTFTPGQNAHGLKWEQDRVKAGAAQDLAAVEFIVGTRKNNMKLMSAEFKDLKLQ